MKQLLFILSITLIFLYSCKTSKHSTRHDINTFYNKDYSFDNITSNKIYHTSDSTLDVYFHINLKNLPDVSSEGSKAKPNNAPLRFEFILFTKSMHILDSGSLLIASDAEHRQNLQYRFRNIKCKEKEAILRTELNVPYIGRRYYNTQWVDFSSHNGAAYYKWNRYSDSIICAEIYFCTRDKIALEYYNSNYSTLKVRYSKLMGRPAPPPFITSSEKVPVAAFDSAFTIVNHSLLPFTKTGNYLILADSLNKAGLWLNCFSYGFPFTEDPSEYINPLIYLTSNNEFKDLSQAQNTKKAADDFWYRATGNERRGANLADRFYHRVEMANENFSSSKEGWKTDRGMIYIVFGKPDIIYKESWGENWIYHEHYPMPQVEFHFTRAIQPWGEDFTLSRDGRLERLWYLAVDAWRNGRIIND